MAPVYDFTTEKAVALADEQQVAFEQRVARVDTTFSAEITPGPARRPAPGRRPGPDRCRAGDPPRRWTPAAGRWSAPRPRGSSTRCCAPRCSTATSPETRTRLAGLMAGGLDDKERALAAQLIGPLVVGNSSFSQELTDQEKAKARAAVQPVMVSILQGEKIVSVGRADHDRRAWRRSTRSGSRPRRPDVASFVGWFLMAVLIVVLLLGWLWRFRPTLWHRDNVLVLTGLLVVGATLALKLTAGRSILQFFLPTAAIGDAARDPARRVARDRRDRPHRGHRRRRQRRLARDDDLRPPRRPGRHRHDPQGRPAPGLRPGRGRGLRRERHGRDRLLAARRARPPGRSSSCGSPRRPRRSARASRRSARSRSSARSSAS